MRTALRLIVLVSVSDFTSCILSYLGYFIPFTGTSCDILAFWKIFITWMVMLLCSMISLLSYLTLKGFGGFAIARTFKIAVVVCTLVSTVSALM